MYLVEFAYNNGYHASTKMRPFEILYGKKCTTPFSWDSRLDRVIVGTEMLQEMEQTVRKVQNKLKATQDRQKSYVDLNIQHKEF